MGSKCKQKLTASRFKGPTGSPGQGRSIAKFAAVKHCANESLVGREMCLGDKWCQCPFHSIQLDA